MNPSGCLEYKDTDATSDLATITIKVTFACLL